jgi:hypothetical protein
LSLAVKSSKVQSGTNAMTRANPVIHPSID